MAGDILEAELIEIELQFRDELLPLFIFEDEP